MDLKTLVILFLKLFGLGLVFWSILQAASAIPLVISAPDAYLAAYLPLVVLPLFVGGALWFMPVPIANTMIKDSPLVEDYDRFFWELERVAITLLGLYLLYRGISDLVFTYTYENEMMELLKNAHQRSADTYASIVTTYVEIAISLIFVLGAKPIAISLRQFWKFGKRWPDS